MTINVFQIKPIWTTLRTSPKQSVLKRSLAAQTGPNPWANSRRTMESKHPTPSKCKR